MTRSGRAPLTFHDPDVLADAIIARVGKNIMLALPLGLGGGWRAKRAGWGSCG